MALWIVSRQPVGEKLIPAVSGDPEFSVLSHGIMGRLFIQSHDVQTAGGGSSPALRTKAETAALSWSTSFATAVSWCVTERAPSAEQVQEWWGPLHVKSPGPSGAGTITDSAGDGFLFPTTTLQGM